MSGIRGRNTAPEIVLRKLLHRRGFRFRLHDKTLTGHPDLVFPKHGAVILDFAQIMRVRLSPSGSLFLNVGHSLSDPFLPFRVCDVFRKYLVLQNSIIWAKSISLNGDSYGRFRPVKSQRYLNNLYEYVFHFSHNGDATIDRMSIGVPFKDKPNIARFAHRSDLRCRGNIWFVPYENKTRSDETHPATFPKELAMMCLRLVYKPRLYVLDPFCGSGTVLEAARTLNLRAKGIDISDAYCSRLRERFTLEQDARYSQQQSRPTHP